MTRTYDAALTPYKSGKTKGINVHLPMPISRALIGKGMNRVAIEITDDGILLHPYVGNGQGATADIPEWSS
jgi:hypothetical protein